MPSYVEGDSIVTVIDKTPTMIKPILVTQYDTITKYMIHITYEDSSTKDVEVVQQDKTRPYKFIYKQEGKLLCVTGIPKVYKVSNNCKYTDFANSVMDSNDLLFDVDCSESNECKKARFYLKDIRDIVDLVTESEAEPEDQEKPEDPNEQEKDPENQEEQEDPNVEVNDMYEIYLNNTSCTDAIKCEVDSELKVTLTSKVMKNGEPLTEDQYTGFTVVFATPPVTVNQELSKNNKVSLVFTEEALETEVKVFIKYFIKEINHAIYDEFTIVANKKICDMINKEIEMLSDKINSLESQQTEILDKLKKAVYYG